MSDSIVSRAFEAILKPWAQGKSLPIVFQNVDYTPVEGRMYVRGILVQAPIRNPSLGGEHRRYIGQYQVSIFAPAGPGMNATTQIVSELEGMFKRGTAVLYDGRVIALDQSPYATPVIPQDRWAHTPFLIPYRMDRFD